MMNGDPSLRVVTIDELRAICLRRGVGPDILAQMGAFSTPHKPPSTFNANRKRTGDDSIAQQPAKRQSNVATSSNCQASLGPRPEASQELPQPETVQSHRVSHASNQDVEEFKRRIAEYKSQLQDLEDEHVSLSRARDPETIKRLKTTCDDTTNRRQDFDKKLSTVDIIIKQMTKTIQDGHEMVPAQLHDALKASKADRQKLVDELNKSTSPLYHTTSDFCCPSLSAKYNSSSIRNLGHQAPELRGIIGELQTAKGDS